MLKLFLSIIMVLCGLTVPAHAAVTWGTPKDATQGQANGVQVMDAGDINGDGMADVAVLCGGMHANSSIFAWFEAPSTISGTWTRHNFGNDSQLRAFLGACILYDFDSDGDLDLCVTSDNHHGTNMQADLYIYINPGVSAVTGSWNYVRVTPSTLPLNHINDIAVDDMDKDGKPDIICRSLEPNQIHIFFQNSISSWTKKTINTGIEQSEGLAIGDIDGNGTPDIEYTGYWLKAPSTPRTSSYTLLKIDDTYKNTNQNTKEDLADIDGDGDLDLVLAPAEHFRDGANHILAWYANPGGTLGNTNWVKHTLVTNLNDIGQVKLRDIDDDGDQDIIYGHCFVTPYYTKIMYNNGSGSFSNTQTVSSSKGLYTCGIIDFDGDGDLDISGNENYATGTKVWVYENKLYDGATVTKYTLTVASGTGDGSYAAGTGVSITADAPGANQAFDKWTGGSGIADVNASTTTITMPAANTTVTATYKTVVTYALTVNSGTGGGNYQAGAQVTVRADAAPSGKAFDVWTGSTSGLSGTTSATATFTMPAAAASITATYRDVPTGQYAYGGTSHPVPGRIEAEYYDEGGQNIAYYDNSTGNRGTELRSDDVDIYATSDGTDQLKVGYNTGDEWVEYTINAEAGTYTLRLRVATPKTDGTAPVSIDGTPVGTVTIPNTGDWETFVTVELENVVLAAGEQVVRIGINGSGWDFNWFEFEKIQTSVLNDVPAERLDSIGFSRTVRLDGRSGHMAGTGIYLTVEETADGYRVRKTISLPR